MRGFLQPKQLLKYNKLLHKWFPEVRVRWSPFLETYQLEIQVGRERVVDPSRYPVMAHDTFQRAKDGYDLLREIEPEYLPTPDRMIAALQRADFYRLHMTPEEYAGKLDVRDASRVEVARKRRKDDAQAWGAELYDYKWTSHRPTPTYHG